MRRLPVLLFAAGAAAVFAACGASDADSEPTAAPTRAASATATASSNATQVSSGTTASPTTTPAETATAEATPTTVPAETATTAPTKPAGGPPAATPAPPTPTTAPASSNPLAASMGVIGAARYFWSPNTVKIAPGGVVTFAWSGAAVHDVSVPAVGFTSGSASASGAHTVAFPSPGTFDVICVIHSDTMKGKVIVQ